MDKRTRELARLLCQWNRRELDERDFANKVWDLYKKEAREIWNNPLEELLV